MAVILSSQLGNLVKQFGPKKLERTILETSKVIGSRSLETIKANGQEHRIGIVTGGSASATWISDNEDLPDGETNLQSIGRVLPAGIADHLRIGRMAADMAVSEEEASSLFMSEMDRVSNSLARHLGAGLYGLSAAPAASATWSGTAADSTVDVTFTDVSMFKPGAAYEFDDASASKTYVVRCSNVVYGAVGSSSANVAGTVSFINNVVQPGTSSTVVALTDTAVATGDTFRPRGTSPSSASFGGTTSSTSQAMNTFDDIAGSATLHGVAGTVAGWSGNSLALSAAYSQEAMLAFMARINARSGLAPTHVIMHPALAPVHQVSAVSSGGTQFGISSAGSGNQRQISSDFDKYAKSLDDLAQSQRSGLSLGGKEIVLDDNCPVGKVYFHNYQCVKLVEWIKLGPALQSGDPKLVVQNKFSYSVQFHGAYNLSCSQRSAVGLISGITNL